MKKRSLAIIGVLLGCVLVFSLAHCGGGGGGSSSGSWCPGVICTNCATDPACNVTCSGGKTQTCVGGAYFGADPNLRCGFCQ